MILLGIDTCGPTGTLALVRAADSSPGEPRLLGIAELAGRTTAAMLVPALRALLSDASIDLPQLTALVVVDGPGSFTGIRIGLSAAKALAEALNLPVFPISRLRVLAQAHSAAGSVLDAGRGEFYLGQYAPAAGAEPAESLLTPEEIAAHLDASAHSCPAPTIVGCEQKVSDAFPTIRLVDQPTATDAIAAALPDVFRNTPPDISTLDGRYLRRSDLYRTAGSVPALEPL